jgi:hypothetical protein
MKIKNMSEVLPNCIDLRSYKTTYYYLNYDYGCDDDDTSYFFSFQNISKLQVDFKMSSKQKSKFEMESETLYVFLYFKIYALFFSHES